ncbi:MAG: sigma-70 family RNA polymerase sigma factor [Terriglobia bacterium]
MADAPGEITLLLAQLREGHRQAESKLMPLVYKELRRLARRYMRAERPDHTLQPTALVHEAYLSLVGQRDKNWQNRAHFFAMAAQQMRHILVDHARAHLAEKRGGDQAKLELDEALAHSPQQKMEVLALDEALDRLAQRDPRQAQTVELRFFGGLSEAEVAEVQGVSTRTVKRDWTVARAWLYKEISKDAQIERRAQG